MPLTVQQKSVYHIIFNATMIARSISKNPNYNGTQSINKFRQSTIETIEKLAESMSKGTLTDNMITDSIEDLKKKTKVSFGQAQKPLNVILKYHYYLTYPKKRVRAIEQLLHCPIDSVVLKSLKYRATSLAKIKKKEYLKIQKMIENDSPTTKIAFDSVWDNQHLNGYSVT